MILPAWKIETARQSIAGARNPRLPMPRALIQAAIDCVDDFAGDVQVELERRHRLRRWQHVAAVRAPSIALVKAA